MGFQVALYDAALCDLRLVLQVCPVGETTIHIHQCSGALQRPTKTAVCHYEILQHETCVCGQLPERSRKRNILGHTCVTPGLQQTFTRKPSSPNPRRVHGGHEASREVHTPWPLPPRCWGRPCQRINPESRMTYQACTRMWAVFPLRSPTQ